MNCVVGKVKLTSLCFVNLHSLEGKCHEKICKKDKQRETLNLLFLSLSLLFLSWLAEQTKNILQRHKLFQQIFFHVSRWNISWLKTDTNKEKKKQKTKKRKFNDTLFLDQALSVTYGTYLQLCFKKSWPVLDHKREHHRISFPTDMIHCSSPCYTWAEQSFL